MKFKKIIFVGILLLVALSLGTVCASDCQTSDLNSVGKNMEDIQSDNGDMLMDEMQTLTIEGSKLTTSNIVETEESSSEDNIIVESETQSINESDVGIDVSNVYKGKNATIYVTAPKATGFVNIAIGDKTYAPEFVNGVATQTISEYNIGLNNVTVKYNDITKETSFKVLDGVITNETFNDYFEIVGHNYELANCIPNWVTLDFRGNIFIEYMPGKTQELVINKPINLVSSTNDAVIDYRGSINILNTAIESSISNIKFNKLVIRTTVAKIINSTINFLTFNSPAGSILNSTIYNFKQTNGNNLFIYNSTFKSDLLFASGQAYNPFHNLTIKNCFIEGNVEVRYGSDSLIDNNVITGGNLRINAANTIVKNNIITSMSTTWAVIIEDTSSNMINNLVINNALFSRKYCGNSAVRDIGEGRYPHVIKNNTPKNQLIIDIATDQSVFYDEDVILMVNVDAEGNVTIDVNGQKYSAELINGGATYIIDKYTLGLNEIIVTYEDALNDVWGIASGTFNVDKVPRCHIDLVYENVTEGMFFTANVVLPDDANGNITFTLNNDTHVITIKQDANGTNNIFDLLALSEGNYTMNATFTSVKYVTNSTSVNFSIFHIPVYELTANAVVMDYGDGSKYKVLVTKDGNAVGEGEVVKITFNGKITEVRTDKNGYATLTLDGAPKTYAIKAEYNGVIKSTKVTIKNILKASNVSKKKAKQIKFQATLKNSKEKAIVGKKITFKFKGKTYSAKTNKKGVATITLKNLKVGKYTITSKYGACTAKNTIRIKK